ncbi:MAG: hypothetical protein R2747_24770 [Pyrinomonadaceae bacterium]
MGTLCAIYFSNVEGVENPDLRIIDESVNEKWKGVILGGDQFLVSDEMLIDHLSKKAGAAVFLGFQSVVDAFQFVLAKDDRIVRKLVYGCFQNEREWEVVEGEEQEWEEVVFFETEYDEDWDEEFDEFVSPLVGSSSPGIDARNTCEEIAEFYDLPGWD